MLTLTQRVGERIRIGTDIVVEVRALDGLRRVRLGIQAPAEVLILRGELRTEGRGPTGGDSHAAVPSGT